jgi:hypothetical protein
MRYVFQGWHQVVLTREGSLDPSNIICRREGRKYRVGAKIFSGDAQVLGYQ